MNRLLILIISVTAIFIASFRAFEAPVKAVDLKVVELFTSQGCSSCPAADKLLSQIADKENVIALSFHVSYWNYLGWKDPYSSEQFTNRQRKYAAAMNLQSIYTPQMIVNGSNEFVGSDNVKLSNSINQATSEGIDYTISINAIKNEEGILQISYSTDQSPNNLKLNIAIVERHVENYVSRGENRGKTLEHDNVVRKFETVEAKKSDELFIRLPEFTSSEQFVVLYLQGADLKIKGGAKFKI